jgi:cytochrome c oxidase subunit 2
MNHEAERYERFFIIISGVFLAGFLVLLAYTSVHMRIMLPGRAGEIKPKPGESLAAAVFRTPPFDHLGVRKTGPNDYEAVYFGQAWAFFPREIELPVGARVKFIATSVDITHGFFIVGTRVNMMLLPGKISEETYTFHKPGKYLLLCHEYCGLLHHTMHAWVIVK